jgi:hypothetical protein
MLRHWSQLMHSGMRNWSPEKYGAEEHQAAYSTATPANKKQE